MSGTSFIATSSTQVATTALISCGIQSGEQMEVTGKQVPCAANTRVNSQQQVTQTYLRWKTGAKPRVCMSTNIGHPHRKTVQRHAGFENSTISFKQIFTIHFLKSEIPSTRSNTFEVETMSIPLSANDYWMQSASECWQWIRLPKEGFALNKALHIFISKWHRRKPSL